MGCWSSRHCRIKFRIFGSMSNPIQRATSFGQAISFENLTVAGSAVALTPPANAQSALCSVDNVTVRFRLDGSNPTSTVGHQLPLDTFIEFFGEDMNAVRFISTGASTNVFVTYFR